MNNPVGVNGNTNGSSILVPLQTGNQNFPPSTNGFNGHSGNSYPSGYQNRMNTPYQPRFQQQQQSQNVPPPTNFVPRKIGQVGGVDVLSTRPPETRPTQMGNFPDNTNQSNSSAFFDRFYKIKYLFSYIYKI